VSARIAQVFKEEKMRIVLPLVLLLTVSLSYFGYADTESAKLYNAANEHYTGKEYHEALDLYLELMERGVQHPSLFYNLANTYFNIGMAGYAVLYFERALLLKPFDRDIRSNLKYVRENLEDKIIPLYDEGALRFIRLLISLMKLKITVTLELVFFTLCFIFILSFLFLPHARTKLKKPLLAVAAVYIVVLIGVVSQYSYEKRHPKGIILQIELEVKSSPLAESESIFTLHQGTKFKIIEVRGEWIRFAIEDGRQGWILKDSVSLIQPERSL
jgi:tetratricopeptide (TPR) repeat protein